MAMLESVRQNILSDYDASYLHTLLGIISSSFFIVALLMWILTGRRLPGPVK